MGLNNCDGSADSCPWRHNPPLTINEATALSTLPSIHGVIAHVRSGAQVKYHDRNLPSVNVDAYTAGVDAIEDGGDISPGRSFTDNENTNADQVIIVNDKMKESLFDQADPSARSSTVDGKPFTVIGVYHSAREFLQQQRQAGRDHPVRDGPPQAAVRRAADRISGEAEGRRPARCGDGRGHGGAAHRHATASVGRGQLRFFTGRTR